MVSISGTEEKRTRIAALVASSAATLCAVVTAIALLAFPSASQEALGESPVLKSAVLRSVTESQCVLDAIDEVVSETVNPKIAAEYEPASVLVQLADGIAADDLNAALVGADCVADVRVSNDDIVLGFVKLPLADGVDVLQAMAQLRQLPAIEDSQPNFIYHLADEWSPDLMAGTIGNQPDDLVAQATMPNDPYLNLQWALDSVHAFDAWDIVKSDGRATVAVLDTGCQMSHEDLKNNVVYSYDAVTGSTGGVSDSSGHGTHVCGIIAAEANNGLGGVGVSYNAQLLPINVFLGANSDTMYLVRAYKFILDNSDYYNIRVANMSVGVGVDSPGGYDKDKALYNAVKKARDEAGVLTVCSAGNDSDSRNGAAYFNYPSDYLDTSMNVIALERDGAGLKRSYYSNYNMTGQTTKDIAAPGGKSTSAASEVGEKIYSTYRSSTGNNVYAYLSGTSMASPCVAGVAALLFAANPDLTPSQVQSILHDSATKLNGQSVFSEQYGYGEVNAKEAVSASHLGLFLNGDSSVLVGGSCMLIPSASGNWVFSSNANGVASVDATGVVTGVAPGSAVITATRAGDGAKVSRSVTVYDISFSGATEVCAGESILLKFNESPSTGMWLIGTSDIAVAQADVNGDVTITGVAPGMVTVEATLASNKNLVVRHEITVKPARTDFSQAKVSLAGWTYDGAVHAPAVTVTLNGATLPTSAYSVSYSGNKNAGTCTATVTPTDTTLYKGVATGSCTVAKRPVTLTSKSASKMYDGSALTATAVTMGGSGFVAGEVSNIRATGSVTNVGSATNDITFTMGVNYSAGNYSVTYNRGTLKVTAAAVASISLLQTSYSYTGAACKPTAVVKGSNGKTLIAGTDYILTYSNNVNGGTATATATGKGNYAGAKSANFTIVQTDAQKAHSVQYRTHVQNVGWQGYVKDGVTSGTSGRALRLEGINIALSSHPYSGSIQYRTHIQNIGWESGWRSDGAMSGTSGRSLRLEAIQVRLTGGMAAHYDVYYRVHAQNVGWMGWARNGASAGTAAHAYRLEAIQVRLVPKGGAAPGPTSGAYLDGAGYVSGAPDSESHVLYRTHVQNDGWQNYMRDGETSGTSGRALRLEGINVKLGGAVGSGGIAYRTHVQNVGWQGWVSDGVMAGTSGRALRLEAIEVKLTGAAAQKYDVYYRVHAQNVGWMGWARNGESAGTAGYAYRLEAIQVRLVAKGGAAPGSTANHFRQR